MCRQGGQDLHAYLFNEIQNLAVDCSRGSEKEDPGGLKGMQSLHQEGEAKSLPLKRGSDRIEVGAPKHATSEGPLALTLSPTPVAIEEQRVPGGRGDGG